MSYILDALNKAEKDRKQQPSTSVPPVSTQGEATPKTRGKYGLYFITVALVLFMLWVLLNKSETPHQQQAATSQKNQVITPKVEATIQAQVVKSQPTQKIEKKDVFVQEKVKTIPNIMGLDSALRNQLPPIVISAHVYSEEVSKRMVIINNQVKHEQQYIGEQLQLTHITPQGIQLQYQGTAFTMKVKDQWPLY